MAEMTWDDAYRAYKDQLLKGDVNADFIRSTYEPLSKDFADRIVAIHKDLANQQKASIGGGKTLGDQWYGGDIGKDDATWDMAFRLAETGAGSLYDIGQRQVERTVEGEGGPYSVTDFELYNKRTGDALTNFNRESGTFDTTYNLQFTPEGMPIAYTGNKQSDWVGFREGAKFLANTIGMFTPAAPYIAAANAANFASKGQWDKAILTGLTAAAGLSGEFEATKGMAPAIKEANKYAKILKSLEDKDLLSAAFQGADIAGVKDLAGYDINDVKRAVNLGMAIKNEDPAALMRAGMSYLPKAGSGKLGFGVDDADLIPGYFDADINQDSTFSGGYVDMSAPDQGEVDLSEFLVRPTPIEIPEIVSEPEYPEMVITAPRLPPEAEPEYPEMVITAPRPSYPQIELTPEDLAPPEITPTPIEIPEIVGPAPAPAPKPPAAPAPKPPAAPAPAPFDLSGLLLLLGGQQQGPIPLTVPDNSADIKLMEEIFGTSLSAPSTGNETDKATALARLLRS